MAQIQPTGDLRGLLVPEAGTLTAAYTATSQEGARAGPVVPGQVTGLLLHGSGALDTASEAALGGVMELATLIGGGVGTATIRWTFAGDTLRSWDPPVMLGGWEYLDRTVVAGRYRHPHIVRRASTGRLAVASIYDATTVLVHRQDQFGKWTFATVEAVGSATRATLVDLPSGRLLCIYAVAASATSTQIRTAYSDDDGATWTTASSSALLSSIGVASSAVVRLRAVHLAGQVSLFVHWLNVTDQLYQYASSDGGCRFVEVGVLGASNKGYPDLSVSQGAIYVACLQYDAAYTPVTIQPWVRRLSSASQAASTVEGVNAATAAGAELFGTYAAGAFTAGELALLGMDDGALYVYGVDHAGTGTREVITRVSVDRGATWDHNWRNSHGDVNGTLLYASGVGTTSWADLSVAPERGRAVMAHSVLGTVTNDYASLCAAYLGGWSTVGMPAPGSQEAWEVAGWDDTYLPIDIPAGPTWTPSLTGAATQSLGANGLALACVGADRVFYSAVPVTAAYLEDGILAEAHVTVVTGTATLELRTGDGTNAYAVRVDATAAQVDLRDVNAGTSIATLAIDCTQSVVIRIALGKATGAWSANVGKVRAWVRLDGPYTGAPVNLGPRQDREWTQIGTSSTLTTALSATNRIRWGHNVAAGTSTWRWQVYSGGRETAGNLLTSPGGTARGHLVPPVGSPVHLTDGLRVHGVDGPTVQGDAWATVAEYAYPVSALNPAISSSPRRRWRSTASGVAADITLTGVDLGARSGDLYGLFLAGANWRTATLYRDVACTLPVCTIDLAAGMVAMNYVRNRGLIYPVAGGGPSMPHYAGAGALIGATVDLGGGVVRTVRSNTGGAWISGAAVGSYGSTRLELDSYLPGDPASGTLTLRMPSAVVLFDALVGTDVLVLRINAQDTPAGYHELGQIVLGRVRLFGRQYSRGRGLSFTPAYDLAETRSGARRVRAIGPTRRAIEISWDDGVDTTGVNTPGVAPDHYGLGYGGADALTAIADTPRTLAGLIAQVEGAVLPVVLLSAIKQQTVAPGTTGLQLLDPQAYLYGRILTDTLRVDASSTTLGAELRDPGELVQVSTVRVEEEV